MKSCVYFLMRSPWIIAFLLPPIFTFAYGSFSNFTLFMFIFIFIVTASIIILASSTSLFSKHKLQEEDETKIEFFEKGSPECYSDGEGSITDEENLIEIELPARNSGGVCLEQLSEINEEDNLIEIDISMGSLIVKDVNSGLVRARDEVPGGSTRKSRQTAGQTKSNCWFSPPRHAGEGDKTSRHAESMFNEKCQIDYFVLRDARRTGPRSPRHAKALSAGLN